MTAGAPPASPLQLLYEPVGLPSDPLPGSLRALYPGSLGFRGASVFANFVSTVDGVVAMPDEPGWSSGMVGGATGTDRFVMALLRACAGALLVGASTFRASQAARWTGERFYPDAAEGFAELRAALGLSEGPELAVVTRGGGLDPSHPAFEEGVLVVTTSSGAARLRRRLSGASEVIQAGEDTVEPPAVLDLLRARGHDRVLSEGGPSLLGSLLGAGCLDELFLTVSPLFAGRGQGRGNRLGLVEHMELLPAERLAATVLGVRRDGSHLFLRYAVAAEA